MPALLAVHPYACGEYDCDYLLQESGDGPSPRVWGIRGNTYQRLVSLRSIPTRVGNTAPPPARFSAASVHPHACGEYIERLMPFFDAIPNARSIPTRVGNTCPPPPRALHSTVHPHACGEYIKFQPFSLHACGPSPRVWGIHFHIIIVLTITRSIPTRVGNTIHFVVSRICVSGPSPRVWGIPIYRACKHRSNRSIPTRVGNTPFVGKITDVRVVHPHACGEYLTRTKGGIRQTRSIPTRVGNTCAIVWNPA